MVDQSRRDLIKSLTKGAVYVTPVISTIAAPRRLMAQASGMMFMICDFFPILCMIFGMSAPAQLTPGAPQAPGSQPAPWNRPPPWQGPPSGSQMRP